MAIDFPSQVHPIDPIFPGPLAGICTAYEHSSCGVWFPPVTPGTTTTSGQVLPSTHSHLRRVERHGSSGGSFAPRRPGQAQLSKQGWQAGRPRTRPLEPSPNESNVALTQHCVSTEDTSADHVRSSGHWALSALQECLCAPAWQRFLGNWQTFGRGRTSLLAILDDRPPGASGP